MPENKDDRLCPIRSYNMYVQHLKLRNPYFWQTPAQNTNKKNPNIWYTMAHLGKNTLGPFMSEVSKNCKLSQMYTNHSIRVTGCTVLTRLKFSAAEIMSVSRHKSVQSLATYQKTTSKEKMQMGSVMYQSLTRKEDEIQVPACREILPKPPQKAILPVQQPEILQENPQQAVAIYQPPEKIQKLPTEVVPNKPNCDDAIVPFEPSFDVVPEFDLLSALCEVQDQPQNNTNITPVTNTVFNNIPRNSMFSNCSIGTINFYNSKN